MSPSIPSHHPLLFADGKCTDIQRLVCGTQPDLMSLCCPNKGGCEAVVPSAPEKFLSLLPRVNKDATTCGLSSIMIYM